MIRKHVLVFVFLAAGQLEQNAGKRQQTRAHKEKMDDFLESRRDFYLILVICNLQFHLVLFAIRCVVRDDFTFKYDDQPDTYPVSLRVVCLQLQALSHAANLHFSLPPSSGVAIKIKSQSAIHNNKNNKLKSIQTPTTTTRRKKLRAKNKQNT